MLENLTFSNPLLWWGALACIAPFLIHWMMRPRPQKVVFPATFLLQKVLADGQKAQRIRNLWLLLVRAFGLVVIAALLAGPSCSQGEGLLRDERPIAGVIVVDDSWSSLYQVQEDESVLDRLRQAGLGVVSEARSWPPGSTLGLITSSGQREAIAPTAQWERVEDQLQRMRDPAPSAATLAAALRQAGEWLRAADPPRRRLVLLSDLAAHAFRDVQRVDLAEIENLQVEALPVLDEPRTNLALLQVEGPQGTIAETAPVVLEVTMRAEGTTARVVLVVRNGDRILQRTEPFELPPDQPVTRRLTLPRFSRGVHGLQVALEPDDRLTHDQVRYVAFEVGPPPEVWLLEPTASEARSLTEHLLENLLAPAALDPSAQRTRLTRLTPEQIAPDVEPPALILLPSGQTLSDTARTRLRGLVERGARLVLLPTGSGRPDWPGLRRYFAARTELRERPSPTGWGWETSARANSDIQQAWQRVAVLQSVQLQEPAEGVEVQARYADEAPALLRRSLGRGAMYLLTTSPDPGWSNLGTRALALLQWLLSLCEDGQGELLVASRSVGAALEAGVAQLPRQGVVQVSGAGLDGSQRLRLEGSPAWPTERPGILQLDGPDPQQRLIALNWAAEESHLQPLDEAGLGQALGAEKIRLVGRSRGTADWNWQVALARPAEWLALLLLVLLGLELVLSEWRQVS